MKKVLILVAIVLLGVVMSLTRPDKKAHKEAMMKAVKEYVDEEAASHYGNNVLTKLGKGVVNTAVSTALGSKLKLDDYYLFNTTHVRLKGQNQLLSVGVLGQVITFNKDMLREKLQEAANSKDTDEDLDKELDKLLKQELKEKRKQDKQALKDQRKREKEELKAQKQREKEARKEQKRKEKEAKKKAKAE